MKGEYDHLHELKHSYQIEDGKDRFNYDKGNGVISSHNNGSDLNIKEMHSGLSESFDTGAVKDCNENENNCSEEDDY